MKKPTSNGNDLYQIGNDYPQVASAYFKLDSYRDGIYTELKDDFNPVTDSALSGDVFWNLKDAKGLNKRTLNVPAFSGDEQVWAPVTDEPTSAFSGALYLSKDYATGKFVAKPEAGEV